MRARNLRIHERRTGHLPATTDKKNRKTDSSPPRGLPGGLPFIQGGFPPHGIEDPPQNRRACPMALLLLAVIMLLLLWPLIVRIASFCSSRMLSRAPHPALRLNAIRPFPDPEEGAFYFSFNRR
jgi:hypothetical protein